MKTKYQKGEEIYILRSQIQEAAYNPRIMGEEQERKLRKAIQTHGLIGTLYWNKKTGNLVAGHQRLKQLDFLERFPKNGDYEIRVTAIDIPEREEKQLNIVLNNPSVQGEFDIDLLGQIIEDDAFLPEDLGFSDFDMELLFGGDSAFSHLINDTEEVIRTKEQLKEIREQRKQMNERLGEEQNAEFYCMLIFPDQAKRTAFLKAVGIPQYEQYINGMTVAKKVGLKLNDGD